jgi:hypothetical protein
LDTNINLEGVSKVSKLTVQPEYKTNITETQDYDSPHQRSIVSCTKTVDELLICKRPVGSKTKLAMDASHVYDIVPPE